MDQAGLQLQNFHFLSKIEFQAMSTPITSALPKLIGSASVVTVTHSNSLNPMCNDTNATVGHPTRDTYMSSCPQFTQCMPSKFPQGLSRCNIADPKELSTPRQALPALWGGEMKEQKGIISFGSRLYKCRASSIFREIQMTYLTQTVPIYFNQQYSTPPP